MRAALIIQMLSLLALVNGAPVILNVFLHRHWSSPVDCGAKFPDGQRLFGSSKTIRGILISVLAGTFGAPMLELPMSVGFVFGITAMAGDLFSSFLKRRMRLPAGARATGLDQIPESLFPLLACWHALSLAVLDILFVVLAFFIAEVLLSVVFFRAGLRERPY